jgi:hypothetical protein
MCDVYADLTIAITKAKFRRYVKLFSAKAY